MKKVFIFAFTTICFTAVFAQKTKNLPHGNSQEIITKGIDAYDKEKYGEAEDLFKTVLFGDTLYWLAQYELALTKNAQKKYDEAISILEKIPQNAYKIRRNIVLTLIANAYDSAEKHEKALELYEKGVELYPFSYSFYYEKGAALFLRKQYAEAEKMFKKSIFCSLTHQRSHFYLGLSYLKQKSFVQGILALNYAVVVNPNSDLAISALKVLNDLYANGLTSYETLKDDEISDEVKNQNRKYKPLEALLNSNFARSKNFKSKTDILHVISLYNQVVFENIEQNANSKSVENLLYYPIFSSAVKSKKSYNTFCYYILKGTNINGVQTKAQKMKKQFDVLVNTIVANIRIAYLQGIEQPKSDLTYLYTDDFYLKSFGKSNASGKEEGEWTYIDNGVLSRKITMKNGVPNGKTFDYDKNGHLIYAYNMKNGEIDGEIVNYFPQEKDKPLKIKRKFSLKDGKYNGNLEKYNFAGILEEKSTWKDDLYNGKVLTYYRQGALQSDGFYIKGNIADNSTEYYENGKIKFSAKKNADGTLSLTSYYTNGNIKSVAQRKDSVFVGKFESFHSTGEKKSESSFNEKGEQEGKSVSYYKNGNIDVSSNYAKGKCEGIETCFSPSGKKSLEFIWKNGKIQQVATYNSDGSEKEKIGKKDGVFKYDFYIHDENNISFRTIANSIDENGDKQGIVYFYNPNGKITSKYNYKDGKLNGDNYEYYANGVVSKFLQMKDGEFDGLYVEYHPNGEVKNEAYYKNGDVVGVSYAYNQNGSLTDIDYYEENGAMQSQSMIYKDKIFKKYIDENNILVAKEQYDENGNLIAKQIFENGNGTETEFFLNGKPNFVSKRIAGLAADTTLIYNFKGKLTGKNFYTGNKPEGEFSSYSNVADELVFKSNYFAGELNGKGYYYENGVKTGECVFAENKRNGEYTMFYPNGKISSVRTCNDGNDENITIFAPDGKTLINKLKCYNDIVYAVSVMGKDGKMSDFKYIGKEKMSFISYYPTGAVSGERIYENGVLSSIKKYYANGKICSETTYKNGYMVADKDYFETGNLYSETNHSLGEYHGISRYYYSNGKLKREANYVCGNLDGNVKIYDINGKLLETQLWFNDVRKE